MYLRSSTGVPTEPKSSQCFSPIAKPQIFLEMMIGKKISNRNTPMKFIGEGKTTAVIISGHSSLVLNSQYYITDRRCISQLVETADFTNVLSHKN